MQNILDTITAILSGYILLLILFNTFPSNGVVNSPFPINLLSLCHLLLPLTTLTKLAVCMYMRLSSNSIVLYNRNYNSKCKRKLS